MNSYNTDGFSLSQTFDSHKEFNDYVKQRISFSTEKSSLINCSICKTKNHKMRYKTGRCNDKSCNSQIACERRVKILLCQKKERVVYFTKGEHNSEFKLRRPTHFGISASVKEKIEELICTFDSRPKRLHVKLQKLKSKNKFNFDHMPTLKQIQDYINNRKKKIGDDNNLNELKTFVEQLKYVDDVTKDDDLFTFGEKFGDGSESEHFQLGFTSKKLLSRVESDGMFHIDATYKIVKYNYPLIILGITDMERRFHPICYMFTSHEQEVDYDHFFDTLILACKSLGFKFEPKFICTDASSAIVNSITSHISVESSPNFSNWLVIMCYFQS